VNTAEVGRTQPYVTSLVCLMQGRYCCVGQVHIQPFQVISQHTWHTEVLMAAICCCKMNVSHHCVGVCSSVFPCCCVLSTLQLCQACQLCSCHMAPGCCCGQQQCWQCGASAYTSPTSGHILLHQRVRRSSANRVKAVYTSSTQTTQGQLLTQGWEPYLAVLCVVQQQQCFSFVWAQCGSG